MGQGDCFSFRLLRWRCKYFLSWPVGVSLSHGVDTERVRMSHVSRLTDAACATAIAAFARLVTGVRGEWRGGPPDARSRVYFANHRSHADFVLIWTVLPGPLRRLTRPVAGADYWLKGKVRQFMGERVFRAVLIDRNPLTTCADPIAT